MKIDRTKENRIADLALLAAFNVVFWLGLFIGSMG
jgi:hypothetical protein